MFAEGKAGAKETCADGVQGQLQQIRDFKIGELLEFAKEQHFAVDCVEAREALTKPENFVVVSGCVHGEFGFEVGTKEEGAKRCFAAIGAEDFESNRVQVSAKESARLIATCGADQGEKRFLCEFLGARPVRRAAADKSEDTPMIAGKEFVESGRIAVRESEHELLVGLTCRGLWLAAHREIGSRECYLSRLLTVMAREGKKFRQGKRLFSTP
jgi:hypothetical protein